MIHAWMLLLAITTLAAFAQAQAPTLFGLDRSGPVPMWAPIPVAPPNTAAAGITIMSDGKIVGTRSTINFVAGPELGGNVILSDNGSVITIQIVATPITMPGRYAGDMLIYTW